MTLDDMDAGHLYFTHGPCLQEWHLFSQALQQLKEWRHLWQGTEGIVLPNKLYIQVGLYG